jgi:hypothetical protein
MPSVPRLAIYSLNIKNVKNYQILFLVIFKESPAHGQGTRTTGSKRMFFSFIFPLEIERGDFFALL